MRPIQFRGFRKDGDGWVYGHLSEDDSCDPIIIIHSGNTFYTYEVHPESIGQYTGLDDKDKRQIFEYDIVWAEQYNPQVYIIKFIEGGFCLYNNERDIPIDINHFFPSVGCMIEKIGNTFEHKHLLEAK